MFRRQLILGAVGVSVAACVFPGVGKPPVTWIASPNFASRDGTSIDSVVMHYTQADLEGTLRLFLDPASQVSAHYVIARDGRIIQMVADRDRAWHAKRIMNARSIGIEHEAQPHQPMAPEQERSSVALLRWLMAEYGIRPDAILGHRFTPLNEGVTDCPSGLFGDETKDALDAWVARHLSGQALSRRRCHKSAHEDLFLVQIGAIFEF